MIRLTVVAIWNCSQGTITTPGLIPNSSKFNTMPYIMPVSLQNFNVHHFLYAKDLWFLFSYPSGVNQTRSVSFFTFKKSKTKIGLFKRSSRTKSTQSSKCCGVASSPLHLVQIGKVLAAWENLRYFKCPGDNRAKEV
ncbi:hypothetical protein TNCV_1640181 [Trichonephila clavipes]|nr:hypothetical protein TNCV_1640181 [Trichonephila clavipes]